MPALYRTIAALAVSLSLVSPACAGGPHSLLILDANTGATLLNQEGDEPRYPASLTKMMTLYLTFEALQGGRIDMKTRLKISAHAANAAPSKLELTAGDEIALEDAIPALITKSANDVAIALAEHIAGSEPDFARLMTAKAHELGMKGTTFKNASGLPDSGQVTTARDMVTLGLHLHDDFPRYFPLFATRAFTYNGATFHNHNTLMLQMPGINGIKTGYTSASGFNLVSSYETDGKHLVGAIFGGESASLRNVTMRVALSKLLSRASTSKTRKPMLLARAKPVPAPSPAARKPRNETLQAAVSPGSTAGARPVPLTASPGTAPVSAPETQQLEVATTLGTPAPLRIDVARVHPIAIGTPQQIQAAPDQPEAAPAPTAPAPQNAPAAAPQPVNARTPSSFEQQMASLAQNIMPAEPKEPAAVPTPTESPAPAPTEPPRAPSTLNDQLAQLIGANPAAAAALPEPSYRLKGPAQPPLPASAPAPVALMSHVAALNPTLGYEIQIGAYATPAEAEKRLTSAASQVPGPLGGHLPTHQSAIVNEKTYYRARFIGFDAATASAACAELNRHAINCIAIKAE